MKNALVVLILMCSFLRGLGSISAAEQLPLLPGSKYRLRDITEPRPEFVKGSVVEIKAPSDATILFDGEIKACTISDNWEIIGEELVCSDKESSITSKDTFGAIYMHLEFKTSSSKPDSKGMDRSNGGIILPGGYEIQILDSHVNTDVFAKGQMGAVFNQYAPDYNASEPPGIWQSMDIIFYPALYKNNKLNQPASVTVLHNGVLIHYHRQLIGPTQSFKLPSYYPPVLSPAFLRIAVQHKPKKGSLIFKNIWIRHLKPLVQLDQNELP